MTVVRPHVWRAVALIFALLGFAGVADDLVSATWLDATDGVATTLAAPPRIDRFRVTRIDRDGTATPALHPGDVIALHRDTLEERLRFTRGRRGDRFVFDRTTPAGARDTVTLRYVAATGDPLGYVYGVIRFALLLVAAVAAVRRPGQADARALAELFIAISFAFRSQSSPWASVWWQIPAMVSTLLGNIFGGYAALRLACTFPQPSPRGVRRVLERLNPALTAAALLVAAALVGELLFSTVVTPALRGANLALTALYFVCVTIAFTIAGRTSRGADARRLAWVAYSLAVAFSGSLVGLVAIAAGLPPARWLGFLPLTFLAAPFGLGYAIVRHKVVDVGFAVNRALVFGTLSAIVVLAFGALEWLLGNAVVRVSHITSATLELGLALVLGFSLRGLHARVDRFVDDVFFRARHEAERALRDAARDLPHVLDPAVALGRAHDVVVRCSGATGAPVYLIRGLDALRVDLGPEPAPDRVEVDDPALVRARAVRGPVALRSVPTALTGDYALPMIVRGALAGFVVLGPRAGGDAYAPDELDAIATVVDALGTSLDALENEAMRREVARVLLDGAPVDGLRRVWDGALARRVEPPQLARPPAGWSE